jgi:carboxymethylenebutenolidase
VSGSGYVSLTVADGSTMRAWVARPDGTPKAGLIVLQEAFGVNPHIRDVAERFAREGYLALAPELFHRTGGGVEFTYKEFKQTMPHMQAMTDESIARICRPRSSG